MTTRAALRVAVATMSVIVAVGSQRAEACSCQLNPPCSAVWKAAAVFIATATSQEEEPLRGSVFWTVQKMVVNRSLRGSVEPFVTIVPTVPPPNPDPSLPASDFGVMSSCDYRFDIGRQYLVYAVRTADGRWTTSPCAGTKPIEQAVKDLDYIASLPNAERVAHIYGTVTRRSVRSTTPDEPAADIAVTLANEATRLTAVTDADGKIDVRVPPGTYAIAPITPPTVRVLGAPAQATVPMFACANVSFTLATNGVVEGRVVREDGAPVAGVMVDVISADAGLEQNPGPTTRSALTNAQGRFVVDAIAPGRYVVSINAQLGPHVSQPYATTYFPSGSRENARVIELGDGERKTGFTLVVRPLSAITISGLVTTDNGEPVAGAQVFVALPGHKIGLDSATTDTGGTFRLRVLAGLSYVIRVTAPMPGGDRQTETTVFVDQETDDVRILISGDR